MTHRWLLLLCLMLWPGHVLGETTTYSTPDALANAAVRALNARDLKTLMALALPGETEKAPISLKGMKAFFQKNFDRWSKTDYRIKSSMERGTGFWVYILEPTTYQKLLPDTPESQAARKRYRQNWTGGPAGNGPELQLLVSRAGRTWHIGLSQTLVHWAFSMNGDKNMAGIREGRNAAGMKEVYLNDHRIWRPLNPPRPAASVTPKPSRAASP